jgi:hypothetical protein
MFGDPATLIRRYTPDQIGEGIWFIISGGIGEHLRVLHDDAVPLEERFRCIRSIAQFYQGLVAPICGDAIGHLGVDGPQPDDPLYLASFMFWDIATIQAVPPFESVVVEVLEEILALPSLTCQEAAIHGLGENIGCLEAKAEIDRVLRSYLARPDLHPGLAEYARDARAGRIQ